MRLIAAARRIGIVRRRRPLDVHERGQLADVVHDLSNVLLAVRGYADLIVWEAHAPEAVKSFAGEITCACERANALTRQLVSIEMRQAQTQRTQTQRTQTQRTQRRAA